MKNLRKLIIAAVLLSSVFIAVAIFLNRQPSRRPTTPQLTELPNPSPSLTSTEISTHPQDKVARTALNAAKNDSRDLLNAYNSGKDMRAFVTRALQQPENGGHFYAHRVLKECEGIRDNHDSSRLVPPPYHAEEDSQEYLKKTEAVEWLNRRCADFLPEETSTSRLQSLWSAARQRDPLVQAASNLAAAFDSAMKTPALREQREAALVAVLKTGDPLLLQEIGLRLALDIQNGRRGYFVGGNFYRLDSNVDVGLAIELLPCGMGLSCDQNDFQTRLRCASGVECLPDRFAMARQMLQDRPDAYQDVIALYESMLAAARQGNSAFFSQP